jgi:hypothetical protein
MKNTKPYYTFLFIAPIRKNGLMNLDLTFCKKSKPKLNGHTMTSQSAL